MNTRSIDSSHHANGCDVHLALSNSIIISRDKCYTPIINNTNDPIFMGIDGFSSNIGDNYVGTNAYEGRYIAIQPNDGWQYLTKNKYPPHVYTNLNA